MAPRSFVLALTALAVSLARCAAPPAAPDAAPSAVPPPAPPAAADSAPLADSNRNPTGWSSSDAETFIRDGIRSKWDHPELRRWRLECRPDSTRDLDESWFVAGTPWRISLVPSPYSLEALDPHAVYDVHGIALDTSGQTLWFYIYSFPRKLTPDAQQAREPA